MDVLPDRVRALSIDQCHQGIDGPHLRVLGEWVAPIMGLVGLVAFHLLQRWRLGARPAEALQGTFTLLTVALVVLTVVGVWFRGPGMELVWPGGGP